MCLNLQNYDSHLTFQETRKNDFKINVIGKTIEKFMSLTINQTKKRGIQSGLPIVSTDSVFFINNSLDSLVKNLGKNYFHHLRQEFNPNVLNLLKKKFFFPMTIGI